MKNSDLRLDDNVIWAYRHHLNHKSITIIVKRGRFLRQVKHRRPYYGEPMAYVWFEGNKNPSKVPLWELEKEERSKDEI